MQKERAAQAEEGLFRLEPDQNACAGQGELDNLPLDTLKRLGIMYKCINAPSFVPVICLVAAFHIMPQKSGGDGLKARSFSPKGLMYAALISDDKVQ